MSEPPASESVKEEVPASLAGERVDRVVALMTGLPRGRVAELITEGAVAVNGQAVTTRSRRLAEGEAVEVAVPAPTSQAPVADATVAMHVVHEDDDVIVVDKPAGLVVHPGAGQRAGTLVHGLLARYPDLTAVVWPDSTRPGIVHRLDKGTSGLLVVARTEAALASLGTQLASRTVERRYVALVRGRVEAEAGVIDAPIGRGARDRTRMAVAAGGREARTRYDVQQRFRTPLDASLVECRLETGRTHQIRVHLAAIGHPVLGDRQYGVTPPAAGLRRPFLHAHALAFTHPTTGARCRFSSPLPDDLTGALARFR